MEPLKPDQMREILPRAKKQLRTRMRSLRKALPAAAVEIRSARVCERLLTLPEVDRARGIASFWPILEQHEVDLRELHSALIARGKRMFYPFMDPMGDGFQTGFRQVEEVSELTLRGQRFHEPDRDRPVAERGAIDVVLVPGLAFAADGGRLGYGVGFYDSVLPDIAPPAVAVGVAFGFQLLGELPLEPHDQRMAVVVTDERVWTVA